MPHYNWRKSRPSSGTSSESPPCRGPTGNRSSGGSSVENYSGNSSSDKRSPSPIYLHQQPHPVVNLTKSLVEKINRIRYFYALEDIKPFVITVFPQKREKPLQNMKNLFKNH